MNKHPFQPADFDTAVCGWLLPPSGSGHQAPCCLPSSHDIHDTESEGWGAQAEVDVLSDQLAANHTRLAAARTETCDACYEVLDPPFSVLLCPRHASVDALAEAVRKAAKELSGDVDYLDLIDSLNATLAAYKKGSK